MLKKISRLFLGLIVCASSACVTPTHASSAYQVVLVHIQAGGPQNARDEMVSIYNNSPNPIDVTHWCLKNKANNAFACLETKGPGFAYILPAYSFAVFMNESLAAAQTANTPVTFSAGSSSSGRIVGSNDTISIVDAEGVVVDSYSWATTIPSGKIASRIKSVSNPLVYETLSTQLNWQNVILSELPENQIEIQEVPYTTPEDPEDPEAPGVPQLPTGENPNNQLAHPIITEILPNPEGADAGKEFIEFYNPNTTEAIDLTKYKLRIGDQLEKSYSFPTGATLSPGEYRSFSNNDIRYTLLNTTSAVQLEYQGVPIGDSIRYISPKDGRAWALFDEAWAYTTLPTPGTPNVRASIEANEDAEAEVSLKPCAVNQYRSLETNRCRNLPTAVSTIKPCNANQYRSIETNRCRNLEVAAGPTACKEGQERNPITNRCRNIIKMTDTTHSVKSVSAKESYVGVQWYWWLGIGSIVLLVLGYGAWEWRQEIAKVFELFKAKFARLKP